MSIEIELPGWIGRERYFLIDADGKAEIHGYHQRPTAERHAIRSGFGLYDRREKQLVIPIDNEKRLSYHRDEVVRKKEDLQRQLDRLMKVEEAVDRQRDEREAADASQG